MGQITLKGQADVRLQPDKASPFLKQTITASESGVLIKCLLLKDDKQAVGSQASADFQDEREDMIS